MSHTKESSPYLIINYEEAVNISKCLMNTSISQQGDSSVTVVQIIALPNNF